MRALVLERGPEVRRRILALTVAGIPVFFLRTGSDPFNVPKLALLIAALSVVGAIRAVELLQGARIEHVRRMAVPALAIGIPVTVAWLFASHRYWSLFGQFARFQGFIPYLLVILLGLAVADAFAGHLEELAWAFIWSGAIVGAYAVIQTFGMDPFSWELGIARANQALSTLGNPNFTGGFLGMVLPIAVGVWFLEPHRRSTLTKLLALIVLGWILARSEGGWAAGIAGSAVVLATFFTDRWNRARLISWIAVVGVAAAVLGTVLVTVVKPDLSIPFTAEERGQWWVAAWDMGMDSPIVGHGPNAFAVDGIRYRTQEEALVQGFNYTDDPHSVPLSLFAGWGLLGLIGYAALVWWVVTRGRGDLSPMGWLFLGTVVAYLVQSILSIDELSLRASLWAAIGGLAVAGVPTEAAVRPGAGKKQARRTTSKKVRARARDPLRRVPAVIAIGVLALVPLGWGVMFVSADARFQHGVNRFAEGGATDGAAAMRSAIAFRGDYRYRHLFGFSLGNSAIPTADRDRLEEMRDVFSFLESFPHAPAFRDQARVLHRFAPGDPSLNAEALALYERAIRYDPFNPLLLVEATEVAVAAADYDRAIELGEPLLERVSPGEALPILGFLGKAAAEKGDPALALTFYERAIAIDPQVTEVREDAAEMALELERYELVVEVTEPILAGGANPRAWGARALALVELGREDDAEAAIAEALRIDPNQEFAIQARRELKR